MSSPQHSPAQLAPAQDLTGSTIGRYSIRSLLGSGGQGEVYCADDLSLHRTVALKRLSPELRANEHYRQRFLREAQRASGINDAHIAGIYDVLEHQGELLLVMEYVEGASLRQRLREPLAISDFLKFAVQCCEALIAAHENGVVHRDIKPENIMLTRTGRVKVLDFGVAKRLPAEGEALALDSTETKAGELSGTPAYMAPELLLERQSDERADIFSLGVVFYELLTGQHPFLTQGLVATVDRILHEEPPSICEQNLQVPPALERIVFRMLAKNPAARYAGARELLAELQRIDAATTRRWLIRPLKSRFGVAAALLLLALLAGFTLKKLLPGSLSQTGSTQALPQQKYVAVLPFRAIGGDAERQAYAEGLTATITAKLTQLTARHQLQVAPAGEIHAHKIGNLDQARKELGANLVVDGSLHASGGIIRVVYSLVDTATRQQLRAETVTADASDPFLVEDKTVEGLLRMLEVDAKKDERENLAAHGTAVPRAYDLYLRGQGYLQKFSEPENLENAIDFFSSALKLDPGYALAHAGLGEAFWRKYEEIHDTRWVRDARQSCGQAVTLDGGLAAAHLCLGMIYNGTGQYQSAIAEFKRALEREPTNDTVYRELASVYQSQGRMAEAEQTYRRAIQLRPQYWAGYNALGIFYFGRSRYSEAADMFGKVIDLLPDSDRGYSNVAAVYIEQRRYQEAIPLLERSTVIRPSAAAYSNLATTYFYLRRFAEAAQTYEKAVKLAGQDFVVQGNLAEAYYWLPEKRALAVETYRKAITLANERLNVNPRDTYVLGNLAKYHAMLDEKNAATSHLQKALALAPGDPKLLFTAALVHSRFGESSQGLEWLAKAVKAGFSPAAAQDDPVFENLRASPKFQQIVRSKGTR